MNISISGGRGGELFAQTGGDEFLMRLVAPVGKGIDRNTAAGQEIAGDFDVLGIHEFDQILHDDIDAVLMKIAMIAEREEIEFEALAFHHPLTRDITDVEVSEVGLPGLGTKGSELGTIESHEILVFGMFVGKGLQHVGIVVVRILHVLISKQGDSLQFIFCSHTLFGSKPCFQFFVLPREEKQ